MQPSKSYNETCVELGLQCGLISKLPDGRLWIDAGLIDYEFHQFCLMVKNTINKEALEALEHGLQYVVENSATKYRKQYTNTINKLKE